MCLPIAEWSVARSDGPYAYWSLVLSSGYSTLTLTTGTVMYIYLCTQTSRLQTTLWFGLVWFGVLGCNASATARVIPFWYGHGSPSLEGGGGGSRGGYIGQSGSAPTPPATTHALPGMQRPTAGDVVQAHSQNHNDIHI